MPRTRYAKTIKLKDTIINFIKDKAPVHVIMSEFQAIYKHGNDLEKHTLCCYAIHYGHMDLVRELWPTAYNPDECDLNPLLCAVEGRNVEAIDMLLDSGFNIDTVRYFIEQVDPSYYTYRIKPAMSIIITNDDVDIMLKLMRKCEGIPLAHAALKCDAEKCFKKLLDLKHTSLKATDSDGQDLLLAAVSSKLSLLENVISYGCRDHGQVTTYKHQSTLHLCVSFDIYGLHRDTSKANFIPIDTPERIKQLLSVGARARVFDQDKQLPLDFLLSQPGQQVQTRAEIQPPYSLEQHSKVILESCELLLDQMSREASGFTVPYQSFHLLQTYLQHILLEFTQTKYVETVVSALDLIDNITLMFIKYGVDVHEENPDLLLDDFFQRCVTHTVEHLGDVILAKYVHDHILKLLLYGSRISQKSLPGLQFVLEKSPQHMKETMSMCLSMMDHALYQDFRSRVGARRGTCCELVERGTGRGNGGMDRAEENGWEGQG